MLQNNHENVHFLVEKVEKDGILCFGQHQSQWSDFQGQKNHLYTSYALFWDTLYISFSQNWNFLISLSVVLVSLWVTDIGNMRHYASRFRKLWLLLPGAVKNKHKIEWP